MCTLHMKIDTFIDTVPYNLVHFIIQKNTVRKKMNAAKHLSLMISFLVNNFPSKV